MYAYTVTNAFTHHIDCLSFVQIANVSQYHTDITTGVNALKDLNGTLGDLPDFGNIVTQIDNMNSTLSSLPNLNQVSTQVL